MFKKVKLMELKKWKLEAAEGICTTFSALCTAYRAESLETEGDLFG